MEPNFIVQAICHTNGGNLPVEVEQTKRNKEADSVGFAQELTMTSNKKCQNEPVIGHQPGTNGESSKFQDSNSMFLRSQLHLHLWSWVQQPSSGHVIFHM